MATPTINESSFSVLAPSNKNKPVYILDEDDDDEDGCNNQGPIGMDKNPFIKSDVATRRNPTSSSSILAAAAAAVTNPSTLLTSSSSCCLTTGMQSFQECSDLQRELLTMQETLFQGMTQKVIATQEQVLQLQQEIRQLQSVLATTRTLLLEEQDKNQVLTGYLQHYPHCLAAPRRRDHHQHHDEASQHYDDPCTSSGKQEQEEKGGQGELSRRGVGSMWMFGNPTALNLKDFHELYYGNIEPKAMSIHTYKPRS